MIGFGKAFIMLMVTALVAVGGESKKMQTGWWKGALLRADGEPIVFNFEVSYPSSKPLIHIHNASERLEVKNIELAGDSLFIEMPFFESSFRLQLQKDGSLAGNWIKGTSGKTIVMPFVAKPGHEPRFIGKAPAKHNITGKWEMHFGNKKADDIAVGEFSQKGNQLSGSIVSASGDYRFLEGIVSGDSLFLGTFDGSHAYVFKAHISDANTIDGGKFFSGPTRLETFSAQRNDQTKVSLESVAMGLRGTDDRLDFRFPDLDGKLVGINDARFKNKVVVIQIMGSWCPNCMDETQFLSNYYKTNKNRGVEMIGLAYEYSTDNARSVKTLRKFKDRFAVDYPILITGVTASDSLRTEKTLPQLTSIKSFPSTIFIGRDGRVKKVHGGFFGPATDQYKEYVQAFEETMNSLLKTP
ncbi:MAG TPA: TlpA disulfide reductase family protein [Flavihumibacter sp.]|nr:TlpA disulfide reductase family protein [Flavihumibacter sp.]HQD11011.1 TlpA disulfide reductase family protein [Flavihumibacter sp.]